MSQFNHLREVSDTSNESTAVQVRSRRQSQKRLSATQVDELVSARKAGATINELAEQFGIHRTTVMSRLKKATS